MHAPPDRETGHSVIQMLMVLAVLALLAGMSLPAFSGLLDRVRADRVRMQLLSAFAAARSTALARRQPVSVCASDDGARCTADWSAGWLVFLDPDWTGQPSSPGAVLHYQAGTGATRVTATASAGRSALRYTAAGRSHGSNLTIVVCVGGRRRATVIVNNSGRARSQTAEGVEPCP